MGYQLGLVTQERYDAFINKQNLIKLELERLSNIRLTPKTPGLVDYLDSIQSTQLKDGILAVDLLKRPEVRYRDLIRIIPRDEGPLERQIAEQIEIQIKYAG